MLRSVVLRIALALGLMAGLGTAPGYAQQSITQLLSTIAADLPTNGVGAITAANVRTVLNALVNSTNVAGSSCPASTAISKYQPFANTTGSPTGTALAIYDATSCVQWGTLNESTHVYVPFSPALPHMSVSVQGTGFPGMDGASGGVNWFLWNAPVLGGALDSAPTLRIDRVPSGTSTCSTPCGGVAALIVNASAPVNDAWSEFGVAVTLNNRSIVSLVGGFPNMVALIGFSNKLGSGVTVTPTWGANTYCADFTGVTDPTTACIGIESDAGACATCSGGTDIHLQRIANYMGITGGSGTHVGAGAVVAPATGVVVDRAYTIQNGGSTGSAKVVFDSSNITVSSAALFMAAGQSIVFDGSYAVGASGPTFNRSLNFQSGFLVYTAIAQQAMLVGDNGFLSINGVNTGGPVSVNAVNGGTSTNTSAFAVVKAALNTTTQFLQMYMQGGSPPSAWISSSHALTINPTGALAFQSTGTPIGDFGLTANTWSFHGSAGVVIDTATGTILKAGSSNTGATNLAIIENDGTGTNVATAAMFEAVIGNVASGLMQLYAQGGSGGTGLRAVLLSDTGLANGFLWQTNAGPIIINPKTALQFQSNGGAIGVWNATGLGVGAYTGGPDSPLTVNANTVASPGTLLAATVGHIIGADGINARFLIDAFAGAGAITFRRANTSANPGTITAVAAGNNIGSMTAFGWANGAWTTSASVGIQYFASNSWTASDTSAFMIFLTTPGATTANAEAMRINASGGVAIGVVADPGTGNLRLAGALTAVLANTATTSAVCYNTGTGLLTYDGTIGTCNTSDESLKAFDGPISGALERLVALSRSEHFGYFHANDAGLDQFGPGRKIGAGAQTVAQFFPELAQRGANGLYSLAYDKLTVPIITALVEVHDEVGDLRLRVEMLEVANDNLHHANDNLERCLKSVACRFGGL